MAGWRTLRTAYAKTNTTMKAKQLSKHRTAGAYGRIRVFAAELFRLRSGRLLAGLSRGSLVARMGKGSVRAVVLLAAVGLAIGTTSIVRADTLQQQIDSLNNQNAQSQATLNSLQTQAATYQDTVNQLQAQITGVQAAIAASQKQEADLQAQIVQAQAELVQQKLTLADDLKSQYVNGTMSTAEMLATSKSLSVFVDAETYREAVQVKIQNTLNTITNLEATLTADQKQVETSLQTEKAQQAQLDGDRATEAHLLSLNQSQQASYNAQIKANQTQISKLRAEQAAANASIARSAHVVGSSGGSGGLCDIGSGNGGYPMAWCNVPQDSINDANGFPARECTSFAYWYFTSVEGQTSFSVSGNAGWWWETSNYPVTEYPDVKAGAIGVEPSSSLNAPVPSLHGGYYGHVMIVKALPNTNYPGYGTVPDGYVLVASMNEDEAGHFMYNLWPANYLMYINPR